MRGHGIAVVGIPCDIFEKGMHPFHGVGEKYINAMAHGARVMPLLIPGLVDLHVHAPQWPQLGTGLDLPLERWLFEHTFPLEARYALLGDGVGVATGVDDVLMAIGTELMWGAMVEWFDQGPDELERIFAEVEDAWVALESDGS